MPQAFLALLPAAGAAGSAGAATAGAAGAATAGAGATGAATAGAASAGGAGLFSSIPGAGSYGQTQGLSDLIGTGQAFSSVLGGIQENKIQSRLSGQYLLQAQAAKVQSANEINAQDYQANRLMSTARAGAASSGVTQGGSARLVNNASFTEQNLHDAFTRYSGQLQANALQYAAANARWQGKVAETAGFVQGGTSLLTAGLMG